VCLMTFTITVSICDFYLVWPFDYGANIITAIICSVELCCSDLVICLPIFKHPLKRKFKRLFSNSSDEQSGPNACKSNSATFPASMNVAHETSVFAKAIA
jgi:hypothetical protein